MTLIQGPSTNTAEVDAQNNLLVNLPLEDSRAGHAAILVELDAGDVTGSRNIKSPEATEDYRVRVGIDQILHSEWFNSAAINSALYTSPVTTMTIVQGSGYLTLNSGNSTANAAVARVTSYRMFPTRGSGGISFRCRAQITNVPQTNNVTEWGLLLATGTAAPTDGAFFRLNAAGELRCVLNVNGSESQSVALNFGTRIGAATTRNFAIDLHLSGANFWIDDILVARFADVAGVGPVGAGALPITFRTYNTGVTGLAQQLRVAFVAIDQADVQHTVDPVDAMTGAGQHASQGQSGGTMGTTASYANSADPTASAALSNTAALVTGFGGQARFNAAATAVTDGIVTSYQNPAGTAAITGRTIMIRGVKISAANLGAAVATTATTLAWSLAYGHTAVSLATAEATASGTKAPRRIPLGFQTWPVGAAIGAMPTNGDVYMRFAAPIPVYPGEFVATVAKFIVGTATGSQVIWAHVTFDAYTV